MYIHIYIQVQVYNYPLLRKSIRTNAECKYIHHYYPGNRHSPPEKEKKSRGAKDPVEEQDEIPGHSVGGLDVKMEVGRNLGLRKSKQDYKKEGRRERKFKRKFFFPYASV